MTPTIITTPRHWYKRGNLAYVIGTPGGSTTSSPPSPTTSISTIDNGLNIQQAADAPVSTTNTFPTASTWRRNSPPTSLTS